MGSKQELGRWGEDIVATLIQRRGCELLDRNWRVKEGEIDLVAQEKETFLFIEVKTRRSRAFGDPLEAITPTKLRRLHILARTWLRMNSRLGAPFRIDCASVLIDRNGAIDIDYRSGLI
jgi:putative endonuclease